MTAQAFRTPTITDDLLQSAVGGQHVFYAPVTFHTQTPVITPFTSIGASNLPPLPEAPALPPLPF